MRFAAAQRAESCVTAQVTELVRVIRTITLLRYLSEPELREQITAITTKPRRSTATRND
jgi:TnpA family transposase